MMNKNKWKDFKYSDLFFIERGKIQSVNNYDEGNIPVISATEKNNGILAYISIDKDMIEYDKCITIANNGSVGEIFYQCKPFVATSDVTTLKLKNYNINKYRALFLMSLIKLEQFKYSYGRKWVYDRMKESIIKLPIKNNGEPDWQYMEDYVKSLNINLPKTSNFVKNSTINVSSWRKFKIQDIFNIINGKGITKDEIEENPGNLPAVQSGETNNGILGYIDLEYCKNNKYTYILDPCLTVARSGTSGFISLQPNGCVVGDSAKILRLKNNQYNSINVLIFLRTLLLQLRNKYAYGRKVTTEKYYSEIIKLPAVLDKNKQYQPDYKYMESYINILPYGDIVVDYTK